MSSLRLLRRITVPASVRQRSTTLAGLSRSYVVSFNRPSPPSLPPKEQQEYEELVRTTATTTDVPNFTDASVLKSTSVATDVAKHPDARTSPKPEFEGDVNPLTGERGGPKQEPLRYGDWSFGGRATDF